MLTFYLKDNYRCSKIITSVANSLIRENKSRFPKEIVSRYSSKDNLSGVFLKSCKSSFDELRCIYGQLIKKDSKTSFAVLTRTNYEAELVCCFLTRMGIGFNSALKNTDPFDHPSVNMILSFMRVSQKKAYLQDYVNVFKVLDIPIPSQAVAACFVDDSAATFAKLDKYVRNDGFLSRSMENMKVRLKLMEDMTPDMQISFIRRACGLDNYLKGKCLSSGGDYDICRERMEGFAEFAGSFSTVESLLSFKRELSGNVADYSRSAAKSEESNIHVLTLHASKGLEFDHVWIMNANEGIIPYKKAVDKGMTEEERRLLYVGMTRAKDRLIISCHKSSGGKRSEESRFLKSMAAFEDLLL